MTIKKVTIETGTNIKSKVSNPNNTVYTAVVEETTRPGRITPTGGNGIKSRLTSRNDFLVTNYSVNPGSISVGDLFDIDITQLSDGSVLIYSSNREVWEATPIMDNKNTIINGGHY